jgi:hypothetical protein
MESWQKLEEHLASFGMPILEVPIVVQFNKQDLPNAIPVETLKKLLKVNGYPVFEAVAIRSNGVSETLKAIMRGVIIRVQQELA